MKKLFAVITLLTCMSCMGTLQKHIDPIKDGMVAQRDNYEAQYEAFQLLLTTFVWTPEDQVKVNALLEKLKKGKESYVSLYNSMLKLLEKIE